MFSGASLYANNIDSISLTIIAISLFLLMGVTVTMLVFVFKYHHSKHPHPEQIHGNTLLEIAWIIIPTILVIGMFFVGYKEYITNRTTPQIDYTVDVSATSWRWSFTYKNGFSQDSILYIPVNKTTRVNIIAQDVLHSFYVKDFRLKEDAVPKRPTFAILSPNKTGDFRIACAEYCGASNPEADGVIRVGHFNMYGMIHVVTQEEYDALYAGWTKKMGADKKPEVKSEKSSTESAEKSPSTAPMIK